MANTEAAAEDQVLIHRRRAIAAEIAYRDALRDQLLGEIGEPISFEDCERKRQQWGIIDKIWRRERDPLFSILVECVAMTCKNGIVFLWPSEASHVEMARSLVNEARSESKDFI